MDEAPHNETTDAARQVVSGRCGALFHVPRIREWVHLLRVEELVQWAPLLEGTGIDPLGDLERAYVTAKTLEDEATAAIVIELAFDDEERIQRALKIIGKRRANEEVGQSDGAAETAAGAASPAKLPGAIRTTLNDEPYVVTRVGARTLVALPENDQAAAASFAGCEGLPAPRGTEAIDAFAFEPSVTLADTIEWPESIQEARISIELSKRGASVDFVAVSTSAERASHDAAQLTAKLNDLVGVDLFLFKMPLIDGLRFVAQGKEIEMTTSFNRTQIDLAMAIANL